MSSILTGLQLNELSNKKLGDYKTAAGADATAADKAGDYKRGDKRMSGIIKATKKEFANDKKKKVAEAGMPFRGVGGAFNRGDDERHDLDPTEWYIVKDSKMYKTSVYPNQVQQAIAQGYSRTRDEAKAKADKQGMSEDLDENLHKWFKEKWVRFGPDGKIRGDCARGDDSEGKPKCLPQSKAQNLGKKGRASAAARKRREDPNPERSGKAINVNTKKKNEGINEGVPSDNDMGVVHDPRSGTSTNMTLGQWKQMWLKKMPHADQGMFRYPPAMNGSFIAYFDGWENTPGARWDPKQGVAEEQLDELSCWSGYHRVAGTKAGFPGSCAKNKTNESEHSCPHCGGEMVSEELMNEKKDACYYKVKSRYKVWPSAYASGALVKCRKSGADSWGNGGKKNESVAEGLNEMDKSAPQPGRDGKVSHSTYGSRDKKGSDYFKGKEAPGKPITKKQMEKDTLDILKKQGMAEDQLDEKWTKKYKDSINCSNPKGFSQKAHCAGKQKNESAIMSGLNQLDEDWKKKLGAAALAGSMALGAGGAHARVTPDGQGGFTGGLKPSATVTAPSDSKPAAEAPKGFSKEYLQKAANPDRIGRYMISVEKAQELLKQGQGQ